MKPPTVFVSIQYCGVVITVLLNTHPGRKIVEADDGPVPS